MEILMRLFRQAFRIFMYALLMTVSVVAHAQDVPPVLIEHKIRAGLVYNFLKYTDWPSTADIEGRGSLKVCLFEAGVLSNYLFPLEGRTAQSFTISITRINRLQQVEECHAVFISYSDSEQVSELLDLIVTKPILTISDVRGFSNEGGMVELSKKGDFIKISINQAAVKDSGLKIGDRLLKLAEITN